jgi:hypothetical protein
MRSRARTALLATLMIALALPVTAQPVTSIDLKQNWDDTTRQKFWFTSQGSRLLPYSWFLHLEQASSDVLFRDAANVSRLGYLPAAKSALNQDGLPIGFVKDTDQAKKIEFVGFRCAACHTSQLNINGTPAIVEGAPALGDFSRFLAELVAALEATLKTPTKLDAFQKHTGATESDLRDAIARLRRRWIANIPSDTYGPGRLDAFGGLYNQVVAYELGVESNARPATAPVSYPFLWDTPRHDKVQWNGSATNGLLGLGPVFRNIGEALGVFGEIRFERVKEYEGPFGSQKYKSSIQVGALDDLEDMVKTLKSPAWPENVIAIDRRLAVEKGQPLYKKYCEKCHQIVVRMSDDRFRARMKAIGTDRTMADNYAERFTTKNAVNTGALKGANRTFAFLGRFGRTSRGAEVFANAILGTYLGRDLEGVATGESLEDRELVRTEFLKFAKSLRQPKAKYKARPLNGIWATAPYLHNGSVPTVAELLKPAASRGTTFYVGSREFDDVNIGLSIAQSGDAFFFDTAKPGNSNTGHEFGTTLGNDEKHALLEFLKTL